MKRLEKKKQLKEDTAIRKGELARDTRRFPNYDELLAWWMFKGWQDTPEQDPSKILTWIECFRSNGVAPIHKHLYEQYEEFRKEFLPHDYVGKPTVGEKRAYEEFKAKQGI